MSGQGLVLALNNEQRCANDSESDQQDCMMKNKLDSYGASIDRNVCVWVWCPGLSLLVLDQYRSFVYLACPTIPFWTECQCLAS